jgi:predicted DNA-binding transcriptional regulator AlpA
MDRPLLSREEMAQMLCISVAHLDRLERIGQAPPSLRLGKRVLYVAKDLPDWLHARAAGTLSAPGWLPTDTERGFS